MKRMKTQIKRREKGIVLMFVILMTAGFATLAVTYVTTTSRNNHLVDNLVERAQLSYTARAGIEYAGHLLQLRQSEARFEGDGRVYRFDFEGAQLSVRITPELGKVDINLASQALLHEVLLNYGLDEDVAMQIAANIIHWRERSEVYTSPSGEAGFDATISDGDYEASGLPIPPHRRFYAVDEIANVMGVDVRLYQYFKAIGTVYGSAKISVYAASKEVLRAIGLDEAAITSIDDALYSYYESDTALPVDLLEDQPYLTASTQARYYRIEAIAEKNEQRVGVYSVVRRRLANYQLQAVETGMLSNEDFLTFNNLPLATTLNE